MSSHRIWAQIKTKEKCAECPFRHLKEEPLIIKPLEYNKVHVMTITEGPNRRGDIKVLTSIANHPTFTFLFALFGGEFKPKGSAGTVYWTHVRKCFINGKKKEGKQALKVCSKAYLEDEIGSMQPKLVVGVGNEALHFLAEYDGRLQGKLTDVFLKQTEDVFRKVKMGDLDFDVAVVPHPSGSNRFWNEPSSETLKILSIIRKRIGEAIHCCH